MLEPILYNRLVTKNILERDLLDENAMLHYQAKLKMNALVSVEFANHDVLVFTKYPREFWTDILPTIGIHIKLKRVHF